VKNDANFAKKKPKFTEVSEFGESGCFMDRFVIIGWDRGN